MAEVARDLHTHKVGAFEKRIHEIDFLRGLLIFIVIFDHIFNAFLCHGQNWITYSFGDNDAIKGLYDVAHFYWYSDARTVIRYICLFLFCFISGISSAFSRNNWKRAIEMIALWAILSVGSRILYYNNILYGVIDFNIIGVLAFSTLFYCFIQNCSFRAKIACSGIWFILVTYVMVMLKTNCNNNGIYLPVLFEPIPGIHPEQIDWMPLLPYIFFFFLGATLSEFIYKDKVSLIKRRGKWERPFCFVGRHSLWVYLGHQIIIQPIFLIAGEIIKACYGYH